MEMIGAQGCRGMSRRLGLKMVTISYVDRGQNLGVTSSGFSGEAGMTGKKGEVLHKHLNGSWMLGSWRCFGSSSPLASCVPSEMKRVASSRVRRSDEI